MVVGVAATNVSSTVAVIVRIANPLRICAVVVKVRGVVYLVRDLAGTVIVRVANASRGVAVAVMVCARIDALRNSKRTAVTIVSVTIVTVIVKAVSILPVGTRSDDQAEKKAREDCKLFHRTPLPIKRTVRRNHIASNLSEASSKCKSITKKPGDPNTQAAKTAAILPV